jgi:DNA adenine methylase
MKPFLKWAGNKYRIIDRIRKRLPAGNRLIEPFAGSGAVFLNTDYARYLVCDSNPDLITLYQVLKKDGVTFIDQCQELFTDKYNCETTYYRLRQEFNCCTDPRRKAALFVYFNRHGYNGLCRYNNRGEFNVPFGRYKRPYFPLREMMHFHDKAQQATFRHGDFERHMLSARPGDVVYCDPPYVPLSASANFTSYSAGGFDLAQQQRLADIAEQLSADGIPVLVSNHNTPFTRQAYRAASRCERFQVRRFISCNGNKRERAGELLALFA